MLRYLDNVVSLRLDAQKCVGCGMCVQVCPRAVLELTGPKAAIRDRDACIECGACARNCPVSAISVNAGVGCATGILSAALGLKNACCCSQDACCKPEPKS